MFTILLHIVVLSMVGVLLFDLGELVELNRQLSQSVERMKARSQNVKSQEALQTDFEGVKIWKPHKERKGDTEPQRAPQA